MAAEYTERMSCEFEVPHKVAVKIAFQEAIVSMLYSGGIRRSGVAFDASGSFEKFTATGAAIDAMRELLASLGCTRKP